MAKTFYLGLGHKARHGKDYLGSKIVQHCQARGIEARKYAFADALKAYCRVAFGMREKDARLLQFMGTEVFRSKDPDIWVRVLFDTIEEQQPEVAVITDMRFPNELQAVNRRDGATIKVTRLNGDGTPWVAKDRDPNHLSETALDDWYFDVSLRVTSGDTQTLTDKGIEAFERLYQARV